MKEKHLKLRLMVMSFLEFAVWGAYLTSIGNYLGNAGMGDLIAWFFAIQGFVCLIMPGLIGFIADKYVEPQRLLGMCQLGAGIFMLLCWLLGLFYDLPNRSLFIFFYTLSTALYLPTIALSNSVAFKLLRSRGLDTVRNFPYIRVFGTIGFIVAMVFVNCAYIDKGFIAFSFTGVNRFQFTEWQFLVSSIFSLILFLYVFSLPHIPLKGRINNSEGRETLYERLGLNALSIFKSSRIVVFFIFSILLGMCLKVTNAYAAPFITSFLSDPNYKLELGASNANLLTSISQCSEALCILLVPFFMKRFGIKVVFAIAMFAWSVRFETFAIGNPGNGLWLLIASMIVYGIAFDFFNISGAIFLEKTTDPSITASAQGLWMMSTMGVGASVGSLIAGGVVNSYCHWMPSALSPGMAYLVGDWSKVWTIFSVFALVTGLVFCFVFKEQKKNSVNVNADVADVKIANK